MYLADGNPLVYLKNYFKNITEKPVIQKQNKDGSLAGGNAYTEEIQLLLQPKGGLQICSKQMICVLAIEKSLVQQR